MWRRGAAPPGTQETRPAAIADGASPELLLPERCEVPRVETRVDISYAEFRKADERLTWIKPATRVHCDRGDSRSAVSIRCAPLQSPPGIDDFVRPPVFRLKISSLQSFGFA